MPDYTQERWPLGWIPSDDEKNGRSEGFLRMDNCYLDDLGVLSLVPGTAKVNTNEFSGYVHTIYSTFYNNYKYRFVGLGDGRVLGGIADSGSPFGEILEGGHSSYAAFSSAFNYVFISSGARNKKFNPNGIYNWGIETPGKPVAGPRTGKIITLLPTADWYPNATLESGSNLQDTGGFLFFDTTSSVGVVRIAKSIDGQTYDSGGGEGSDEDRIQLKIYISDTTYLESIKLEVYLGDSEEDYYDFQWSMNWEPSPFTLGDSGPISVLQTLRKEFVRHGSNSELNWHNITSIRLTAVSTDVISIDPIDLYFFGSGRGPLNGDYEYLQINVHNNSNYLAKSGASPISDVVQIVNGRAAIYPSYPIDYANEVWLFRRSAEPNIDVTRISEVRKLDQFYRVAVFDTTTDISVFTDGWEDEITDEDALAEGTTVNYNLFSIRDLSDPILGISGLIKQRFILITYKEVIVTSLDDPDSYNPFHSVRLSGDAFEKNLWVANVGPNTVLIGTTKDIYEVGGTFQELPDGSLDISVTPLGVRFAPITMSFARDGAQVFYLASDGLRMTEGSRNELIQGNTELLYKKQNRYGIPPVLQYPNAQALYALAISKGQLWAGLIHTDGTRKLHIYDVKKQYWHLRQLDPVSFYVEEDGTLLAGFGGGSGNFLRILDTGTQLDESNGQVIHLLTIFNHYGFPRNRKDFFTFKLVADTGNQEINISLAKDGETLQNLGNYAFNGITERLIEVNSILGIGKRVQLKITGTTLSTFKLYMMAMEFDNRPPQLNYLRIPPVNLNTASRKRFINLPLIIDTLGADVNLTPYIDNVAKTASIINASEKLTHVHYFTDEQIGTDIGAILSSSPDNPFEYYGINYDEILSEKLPVPTKFLVIPSDDYGNPNRKRHTSYKFQINTRGASVRFTPKIDGTTYTPEDFTTTEKRTVEYFFDTDTIGIDIGGTLESTGNTPFEFYGRIIPQDLEILPPRLRQFTIPPNDYGIPNRKRHTSYKFHINTNGQNITFTPIIDGVSKTPSTFNTASKELVEHFFTEDTIGKDIGGTLDSDTSIAFEFYGDVKPQEIEVLPPRLKYFTIPPNDYGEPNRKRHSSYKFQINTNSANVTFTPIIDGVSYTPSTFNTTSKKTVEHFFDEDIIGIDIGGTLSSDTPFEFYGVVKPQEFEKFPPRLTYFRIPENNYNIPAKKRIRTMPMEINTSGYDVTFTPIVDGVSGTATTLNTSTRKTAFHYFITDVFGIDFSGVLAGAEPFEFYKLLKPEEVEIIPVGKRFDQIGPFDFNRLGKLLGFRLRVIANEVTIPYKIYSEDNLVLTGTLTTVAAIDKVYEEMRLPKTISGTAFRIELGPTTNPFHRYYMELKHNNSGKDTDARWIKVK